MSMNDLPDTFHFIIWCLGIAAVVLLIGAAGVTAIDLLVDALA